MYDPRSYMGEVTPDEARAITSALLGYLARIADALEQLADRIPNR